MARSSTDEYLDYRFHLFRTPHPNAFALPDGKIYIHTGMLAILENEAQLATLIGHEINHAAGHHPKTAELPKRLAEMSPAQDPRARRRR